MNAYLTVFFSVFLAELGDKTQLATVLFAAQPGIPKLGVFLAAAAALCLSTALAVVAGEFVSAWIPAAALRKVAGVAFVAIGVWMLLTRS